MPASYSKKPAVAVVGGGVCGLGIAWRLAAAGCEVDVFDRAEVGTPASPAASWAAAGMLAAQAEYEPGEDGLLGLCRESQRRWPAFVRDLEAAGGAIGYRDEGTLVVALTRDDTTRLHHEAERQRAHGLEIQSLSGAEARHLEPWLAPAVQAALRYPGDHQVDNRMVVPALVRALAAAGGRLHQNAAITRIDTVGGTARSVQTSHGRHPADVVVLAAGAWSNQIDGVPERDRPPVRPVKGQMLAIRMNPAAPLLNHVVWAPGVYLVPRRDGRLVIGATVEERGFEPGTTAGGMLGLLHAAWRALPGIQELAILDSWWGFRPGSPDDAPLLGPSSVANLLVATGHHRNGILLLPVTVDAICSLILDGTLPGFAVPFHPARFGDAPCRTSTSMASAGH